MDDLGYLGDGGHYIPAHAQQYHHQHDQGVDSLLLGAQLDLSYMPQHPPHPYEHSSQEQQQQQQQQQQHHQLPAAPQQKYYGEVSHLTSSSPALEFALETDSHTAPNQSPWSESVDRFSSPPHHRAFSFGSSVQLAAPLSVHASPSPAWPAPDTNSIMMAPVHNPPVSSNKARGKRPQGSASAKRKQPSDTADSARDSASPTSPDANGGTVARKQNSACDACRARKVACKKTSGASRCVHCESKDVECTRRHSELVASGGGPQRAVKKRFISQSNASSLDALLQFVLQGGARYEVGQAQSPNAALVAAENRLANAQVRAEFSRDLIETFLSIVHPRLPVIEMESFRARFYNQHSELGPPPLAHVAIMLAWGARFSESPILVADRAEAVKALSADQRIKRENALPSRGESYSDSAKQAAASAVGASSIADMLLLKAQDVMTLHKVHREPTLDNIRACILVTPLLMKSVPFIRRGSGLALAPLRDQRTTRLVTDVFWPNAAIDHLYTLGVHLQKHTENGQTTSDHRLCWWLCVSISSHTSARDRLRPRICTEDYTLQRDRPTAEMTLDGPWNDVPTRLRLYRDAVQQMSDIHNMFYPLLWAPGYTETGVPARNFEQLLVAIDAWRLHLPSRGAPSTQWPSDWTFAKASTHATEDISFHLFYVLLWQGMRELGMRELLPAHMKRGPPDSGEVCGLDRAKDLQTRVEEEALNAALRIASLCQVLTAHGYLRLDAGVMKCAFFEAGLCLAELHRREVVSIIHGLRQCGLAFPECFEQADMLESTSSEYMSPVFPRITSLLQPPPATPLSMASQRDERMSGMPSFSAVPMEAPPSQHHQEQVPALYAEYHAPGQRLSRVAPLQASPTSQQSSHSSHASALPPIRPDSSLRGNLSSAPRPN